MRKNLVLVGSIAAALAGLASGEREARACGGCFHPPPAPNETPSVITDHRMVLSISSQQTTLYDQIRYQGSPSSFAWVLPISGEATIGLSADIVFGSLDATTAVGIDAPYNYCPGPNYPSCPGQDNAGGATFADAGAAPPPSVTVTKEETVGPYETVQLKADDPNALLDWLTSHDFTVPDDVKPIIAAYTNEHFGFLAMKLVPGAQVTAMRPVRVTTPGASPVLPLRMVAAGTGAVVGITLWVVGEGRYETQNFPSFTINPSDLVWDFATSSSNYTTLRAQNEQALGGRGWQVESSVPVNPMSFANVVRSDGTAQGQGQFFDASVPASIDYDPQNGGDGGVSKTAEEAREEDLDTLFQGMDPSTVRVTRLRTDLAKSALANDLTLKASADQSELPNRIRIQKSINAPACPVYPPAPACPPDPTGIFGDYDGGTAGSPFAPSGGGTSGSDKESFSCAASPANDSGTGTALLAIAGLAVVSTVRARRRNRR